jgi:disulfide bond formation protein DsbB
MRDFRRNLVYGEAMLNRNPDSSRSAALSTVRPPRSLLALALVMPAISAATILGALGFQHIGGYEPCALCLMQRTPYYVGIPIAAVAVVAAWLGAPRWILVVLFAAFGLLLLYNAGLAAYHSGVEWGFWEGPSACAQAPAGGSASDMLGQLGTVTPASCTEAVWRLLGLSFAGWNVLVSGLLAVLGLYAAAAAWRVRAA